MFYDSRQVIFVEPPPFPEAEGNVGQSRQIVGEKIVGKGIVSTFVPNTLSKYSPTSHVSSLSTTLPTAVLEKVSK